MTVNIHSLPDMQVTSSLSLSDAVFSRDYDEGLIHRLIVCYDANARQGTKAQKNRSAVSGGGAKPFSQKGGGRARAGTTRGPIWRGGGVTFAAQPRSYSQKFPKKMYRAAMASILSQLVREERMKVVESVSVAEPKTKAFVELVSASLSGRLLIIVDKIDDGLLLASRNVPNVCVELATHVNPRVLLAASTTLVTTEAVKQLEERFS